jgi:hypothetical protein
MRQVDQGTLPCDFWVKQHVPHRPLLQSINRFVDPWRWVDTPEGRTTRIDRARSSTSQDPQISVARW